MEAAQSGEGVQVPRKGDGKGKGKAPPPPGPAAQKGNGKGKPVGVPPPEWLVAPTGPVPPLRADLVLPSAKGTIWEGLEIWGQDGSSNVLEATVMDYDSLMNLWTPIPSPPPRRRQQQVRRAILPRAVKDTVEIAVRGTRLSPELVRRALTEDMLAITAEQAEALNTSIVPFVAEAFGELQASVNRDGADALEPAEAVLWAIHDIPQVTSRANLLAKQHSMCEDVARVRKMVEQAKSAATQLESRPMRSLLQMILAVRNILAQAGHEGLRIRMLGDLGTLRLRRPVQTDIDPITGDVTRASPSWINENNPSVLALVAQMLEKSHENRCRLRFLRMLAVGRYPASREERLGPNCCRLIWSYLDDLHESPRDVLDYLQSCSQSLCDREVLREIELQAMTFRVALTQDFVWVEQGLVPAATATSPWASQMQALRTEFETALQVCDNSIQELSDVAVLFCRLAGEPRQVGREAFSMASEVLRSLRKLGNELNTEIRSVQVKIDEAALKSQGRADGTRKKWPLVDTSHILLQATDPAVIRELRAPATMSATERPQERVPTIPEEETAEGNEVRAPDVYCDLVHGGLEGSYARDPVTGRWGRRLDGLDGTEGADVQLGGP
mmetsp:Transcript_5738/g.10316  ORF Transcript_5738/g.10316 Transcript_5738/m.10316 type:complete len:614 (+) Transcript_5738:46-1887(+)